MIRKSKGITLIALVITIIVLLILAGVTISMLTGENGILKQATNAKTKTDKAKVDELIKLAIMGSYNDEGKVDLSSVKAELDKNGITGVLQEDSLKVTTDDKIYTIDNTGKVDELNTSSSENAITQVVSVGDYVTYNPTKTDAEGKQNVDSSKTTYVSPVGTVPTTSGEKITHGNGNSEQTFTAKDSIKWRVLNVNDDGVELISENAIKTDAGENFTLKGGIGYLYAEQELNDACKIYGYGYGANTALQTEYKIGGPDEEETKTSTGSGARSININDVNKQAGITESDFKSLIGSYGIVSEAVEYPTITSTNVEYPGRSTEKKVFTKTLYGYDRREIKNEVIQSLIFDCDNFFVNSRFIGHGNISGYHNTYGVSKIMLSQGSISLNLQEKSVTYLCYGNMTGSVYTWGEITESYGIRPIVTIKSDMKVKKDTQSNSWILQ